MSREIPSFLQLEHEGENIFIEIMNDSKVDKLAAQIFPTEERPSYIEIINDSEDNDSQTDSAPVRRKCNVCNISFKFLGRHLETHGPYNCTDCLINFPTQEMYDDHLGDVHTTNNESVTCGDCGLNCSSLIKLAIHHYKHTEKYTCPICNFTVKGKHKHTLVNHIKRHQGHYAFSCEICGHGLISKTALISHMEIHAGIPKYECEFCHKKFTVKRYLDVHRSLNHKKELFGIEQSFQCEICGRNFSFQKSLVRHLSSIHDIGKDRTVDCPVCNKKIVNNHNLKKHMRVHTGEKLFCCDVCGKAFAERKYLQKHQGGHERANEKAKKNQETLAKKIKLENSTSFEDAEQSYLVCQISGKEECEMKVEDDDNASYFPY
ncbi:gastrula zinc finger protein XlCGF8.2DB [Dendroctonus ponderosae]|uniref:C2H2-type domain-containing protein n=1 Tax=Dendroctonus ponderosae TaxID=77166 RepID=A0AAR5PHZ9_DENPD|nr:gastrula zinc finger protein XlCGF8.2DB [Dendroctonus ponderosae]KAH1010275.1 hypothetical protein HUJ05_004593 [Dendroctonus ponderosae]